MKISTSESIDDRRSISLKIFHRTSRKNSCLFIFFVREKISTIRLELPSLLLIFRNNTANGYTTKSDNKNLVVATPNGDSFNRVSRSPNKVATTPNGVDAIFSSIIGNQEAAGHVLTYVYIDLPNSFITCHIKINYKITCESEETSHWMSN